MSAWINHIGWFLTVCCLTMFSDASFLDEWAFERLEKFLNESKTDSQIQKDIKDDGLIVFLHLLGCDTNGHAHRPYSDIYLNNINLVDRGVESTVKLMEDYFPEGKTAYVFTSDHGMSNKGWYTLNRVYSWSSFKFFQCTCLVLLLALVPFL
jgi:predicted AlkP superfamily pyrophosphatase or phosphodiesterase